MTLNELSIIATYLNLATDRIVYNGGSLQWLTGSAVDKVKFVGGTQNQETQCMCFGSSFWIANNHDGDTKTQFAFVNQLGISNAEVLLHHAKTYGQRVLLSQEGKDVNPHDLTSTGLLFLALLGGQTSFNKALPTAPGGGSNQSYDLTSSNDGPVPKGILFVLGSYEGDGKDSDHAEQKLIAALGRRWSTNESLKGNFAVAGVKSACGVCRKVLEAAHKKLAARDFSKLHFEDKETDAVRSQCGLNPKKSPSDINSLAIDSYFKSPT